MEAKIKRIEAVQKQSNLHLNYLIRNKTTFEIEETLAGQA